ncbi:MAG: preprotein translocase subunit SecG [Sphingopyxis sp.]
MFKFLLVVQALVTLSLIGVILMQKSEGGGLGMGGSPSGFLSARGAADFLSRATAILAFAFVSLSVTLAVLASVNHSGSRVDASAANGASPSVGAAPIAPPAGPAVPTGNAVPIAGGGAVPSGDPLAAAAAGAANAPVSTAPPAEKGVPLQQ